MAAALGVEPHRLLTAYQIHSPHVVVVDGAVAAASRVRAPTPSSPDARPRHRRDHGRLRPDPSRRSGGPRDRRGACRLARRADRHCRGDRRRDGAAWRRTQPHPRRARSDDPAAQLRSRPRSHRPFCRRGSGQRALLRRRHRATAMLCSISRASSGCGSLGPAFSSSKIWAFAPTPIRRDFSASAALPIRPRRITAATSTRLRWPEPKAPLDRVASATSHSPFGIPRGQGPDSGCHCGTRLVSGPRKLWRSAGEGNG